MSDRLADCSWCRQDGCTPENEATCPCPHHKRVADQLRCRCGHREGTHERGGHGRCDVSFTLNDGDRITKWRCACEAFKNKKEPS